MIDPRVILTYAISAALVLAVAGAGVQTVRLANERAAHSETRAARAQQLQRLADKAAVAAHAAVLAQHAQQKALAAIDTKHTTEMSNALTENERLRAADRPGARRLRVPAVCPTRPADPAGVPSTTPAASVDDGAAEISAALRQDIWDLRAAIITETAQLKALQDLHR